MFSLSLPYREENRISYLQPGVQYCVTVSVRSLFITHVVSSEPVCAFTSPPPASSSLYLVFSLLGAFCALGVLLTGLVVCAGQLNIALRRRLVQKALSYILLQRRHHGRAPIVDQEGSEDPIVDQEGSADCLLTASRLQPPRTGSEGQQGRAGEPKV